MLVMIKFKTYQELRQLCENSGGVMTVDLGSLRDAYGVDRLGVHVKSGIKRQLESEGLGSFPAELPNYQHELVRVYRLGTPVADLIDAVLTPSEQHDEELRCAINGDSATILQKVRELVCE